MSASPSSSPPLEYCENSSLSSSDGGKRNEVEEDAPPEEEEGEKSSQEEEEEGGEESPRTPVGRGMASGAAAANAYVLGGVLGTPPDLAVVLGSNPERSFP
jgi:hypothetical protein